MQTSNQVVAIDPSTDQVIERHQTPGCEHPHGLLIHPDQHRAFVACQGNDELIIMDMTGMQVTSCVEVGKDPDVLAPDPGLHLVYVAAESGPLAVLRDDATGISALRSSRRGRMPTRWPQRPTHTACAYH